MTCITTRIDKLQYTGNDKKLSTTVQINEGITRPGAVADPLSIAR